MKDKIIFLKASGISIPCDLLRSKVIYTGTSVLERCFERFDFTDEWNNLGYGRITTDGTPYSISDFNLSYKEFDTILARYHLSSGETGVYAGVRNKVLVFNREIGPLDGVDAHLIEDFVSESDPVLIDIPYGFKSAVTMRIDCDEAVSSGKNLFNLYKKYSIPFSMAIKTSLDFHKEAKDLIFDIINFKGSILSHSHTHAPNWGGEKQNAMWEAEVARNKLKEILPSDYNFDFVVSPFHQNPKYAVEGLRDAGIKGFVSGIIKNDPDYLVSRASWAKDVPGIITHSQQCMLHGDCYHNSGNSLHVYKESFANHYKTNTFFGFLDHPFSDYKYGWNTEEERLSAHEEFLMYMKEFEGVWFANLVDAMSFLWVKVNTKVWLEDDILKWNVPKHSYFGLPDLCVLWKGNKYRVPISG